MDRQTVSSQSRSQQAEVCNNPKKILPKNLLGKIFMLLSVRELAKFCQTSKSCQGLCDNDGFWFLKFSHDFGTIAKPNNLNWKQHYRNFYESGPLYLYDVRDGKSSLVYDELIKHINYEEPKFLITHQNDLILMGNPKFTPMSYSLKQYVYNIGCGTTERCLIMTGVTDINLYPTRVLILETNGNLLMVENNFNPIARNVIQLVWLMGSMHCISQEITN